MRNKITLLSLLIFAMVLILSSCSGEISASTPSVETKDSYEEMKTESKNAMSMFGTVKSIVELDFSMSRGPGVTNINDEENDLISTYHIGYYDSISDSISAILNSVPKEEFHIPGIKNKIDSSANYAVLFRSFYFKGKDKATPAYRKVYLLDRESIDKHNNVMMQLITCSPDFVYDIDNQLEISTGKPAKYDWESGNTEDADHFVIDDVTSFGSIDSLIEKKWILVDSAGEPVKRQHSDASYVLKLTKQDAFSVFPFDKYESGSFSSEGLRIKNHIYSEADIHNYAFLVVDRYPENYRFVWEIKCYWYSEGKWHYSNFFQTEEDMIPIVYVDVTESKILSFYTEAKAIGTITRIYQAYKGTAPYLENSKLESFVVEYSKAHDNLRTVIENDRGKALSGGYSNAGRLQDSTVAYANILHNVDTNELSAAIMVVDSYTSYIYLTLEMFGEELRIENKLLSSLDSIYYETKTGKFRDISSYDGSLYYSEYEHADELVATLKQLGTITDVIYFTGKTGQTKPHKNIFSDSPSYYVAIAAQFSSFNQDYLESNSTSTRPQNPYFTVHSKSFLYDFDYQKPGTVTAELDVFFNEDGSVSEVQVRKVTNPEAMDTRNYATTYVMNDSFILTSEDVRFTIMPRYYSYNPETDSSYEGDQLYSKEFKHYYVAKNDSHIICYPHSIYMAYILGGGTGSGSPEYAYRDAFYWYLINHVNAKYSDICKKIRDKEIDSWLETLTANYQEPSPDEVTSCDILTVYSTVPSRYSDSDELILRDVYFYKPDKNFLKLSNGSFVTSSDQAYIVTEDWGNLQVCWLFLPYSYLETYESSHGTWYGTHHIFKDYLVYRNIINQSDKANYNYTYPASILRQAVGQ